MYDELDKWSYITTLENRNNYQEGRYMGLGYNVTVTDEEECVVKFVYSNSPTGRAGLQRGDKITQINGHTMAEIIQNNLWNTVINYDQINFPVTMMVEKPDGSVNTMNMAVDWVTIDNILHHEILEVNGQRVGYVMFNKFHRRIEEDLNNVFSRFRNEQVDELIVDLRYNSGGQIPTASNLSSLIAGERLDGQLVAKLNHNDRYQTWNWDYNFQRMDNSLNLNRVFIITNESTASASELVINSLMPFTDVILVGRTTHGKPVGMHSYTFGDKFMSYIEFEVVNAQGQTGYFDGIEPTCMAEDDLSRLIGDTQEDSLREALYYIANDSCSPQEPNVRRRSKSSSENKLELKGFRREIGAY